MRTSVAVVSGRWLTGATVAALLAACQTRPEIRTRTAPDFEVGRYQTYGFVEHPSTDTAGYTTLTTRYLKDSVTRELQARGYTQSESPELLVNFRVGSKERSRVAPGPPSASGSAAAGGIAAGAAGVELVSVIATSAP